MAAEAQRAGLGKHAAGTDLERLVDAKMWTPRYPRLKRKTA